MALASRVRLGPYEIISPLGAGGMGEVYRATDTRLERVVAIKVLVVLYEMATGAQPFRGETYEDFLTLWKDADPGVPILRQAKAEYARLPGQAP